MTNRTLFSVLLLCLGATACTAEAPVEDLDLADLSEDDADDSAADKADSLGSTATFYFARHDTRRCAYPLCGGYFVHRANYSLTRCATGGYQAECYVADLDLSGLSVSGEIENEISSKFGSGEALLRGSIRRGTGSRPAHAFVATEAYRAATDAPPSGIVYRLNDNGIRCFAAPCFSTHEAKLNSITDREISDLDLEAVGASDADLELAYARLNEGGLIVAGSNRRVRRAGPAGAGVTLDATQIYLPFSASAEPRACGARLGDTCAPNEFCSFELAAICGFADATGVCQPKPEACIEIYSPVCGCDGNTYGNSCVANAAGTSVQREGACETTCATDAECGEGKYCQQVSCGAADEAGTCEDRPTRCTREFHQVCGCDGHTYSNACNAAAAGVSVSHEGVCDAPADCRMSGCGEGQYCSFCWGSFACIPEGALC